MNAFFGTRVRSIDLLRIAITVLVLAGAPITVRGADPIDGKIHYEAHCAMCHGTDGRPSMPGAADFRHGEGLFRPDQSLRARIEQGGDTCPGYWGVLSRQEILNLIAYLRTLLS